MNYLDLPLFSTTPTFAFMALLSVFLSEADYLGGEFSSPSFNLVALSGAVSSIISSLFVAAILIILFLSIFFGSYPPNSFDMYMSMSSTPG
jgi:preprotein translocase subunit SecF